MDDLAQYGTVSAGADLSAYGALSAPQTPQAPGFGARMVEGSQTLSALAHPMDTLSSILGIKNLVDAHDAYEKGDAKAAATHMMQFVSGPAGRIAQGMVDTSGDQFSKAADAFKQALGAATKEDKIKHFDRAIAHAGAGILPVLAKTADSADLFAKGDTEGGAGLVTGNALDFAVPWLAGKAKAVAAAPGIPKMAAGGAMVAGGSAAALGGHPYVGVGTALEGANLVRQGLGQMRAARAAPSAVPPALPVMEQPPPLPVEPPSLPPALPVQATPPSLPDTARFGTPVRPPLAQPEPVAAPAPEPVTPFNHDSLPPDPYKSTPGYERGLIKMLERQRALSPAQQQMLADLKARQPAATPFQEELAAKLKSNQAAASSPVTSGDAPAQEPPPPAGTPPAPAAPQGAVQTIPFSKESPPAEFFKQKARESRMDHVEALAKHFVDNEIDADNIPKLKAADLRAVAQAVGVELPKSLAKTQMALKQRVAELQAAREAAAIKPSNELMQRLNANPRALEAARQLAEEMAK